MRKHNFSNLKFDESQIKPANYINRYRIHESNHKKPICNSHEGCKQELKNNAHYGTPVHIAVLFDEKLDWKHLHKMALEYPENPTEKEKA